MTHHHHQPRSQVVDTVLNAARHVGVNNVSRDADDKQIAETLVEQQFRRNA